MHEVASTERACGWWCGRYDGSRDHRLDQICPVFYWLVALGAVMSMNWRGYTARVQFYYEQGSISLAQFKQALYASAALKIIFEWSVVTAVLATPEPKRSVPPTPAPAAPKRKRQLFPFTEFVCEPKNQTRTRPFGPSVLAGMAIVT